MIEAYRVNHNPKYSYLEPIQTFKNRKDLPSELYNLDILDGSPPCSSFSMAGNREKDWGEEKQFREGQAMQVLDTLFFDFIDLAKELQPKVVVAENVKGLLMGDAKQYVIKIYKEFEKAGYYCQHFLLDASKMGVPQKRERVFFIALRKDLAEPFMVQKDMFTVVPELKLDFNEKEIPFKDVYYNYTDRPLSQGMKEIWDLRKKGDLSFEIINEREKGKKFLHFGHKFIYMEGTINTILGNDQCCLFDEPRYRNFDELCESGTYPKDYNFQENKPEYLIGMSVPPVMTAQVANKIYEQWLSKL
jgi:DNA (cytosine-5)-methyltransferase 1